MKLSNHDLTEKVFCEITKEKKVKYFLNDLREHHPDTYLHSIKVSFLCIDIGISKGFSEEDLVLLGVSALLHDIGKLLLPSEILSKKKPTESEKKFLAMCPRYAFITLRDAGFDQVSKIVVAHSEFQKSKKYPRGGSDRRVVKRLNSKERRKTDPKLMHIAQIVALADLSETLDFKKSAKQEYSMTKVDSLFKSEFLGEKEYIHQILERM